MQTRNRLAIERIVNYPRNVGAPDTLVNLTLLDCPYSQDGYIQEGLSIQTDLLGNVYIVGNYQFNDYSLPGADLIDLCNKYGL